MTDHVDKVCVVYLKLFLYFIISFFRRQFLEIGKDDNDMDFSKIVENHRSKEKQTPSRTKAKEKIPSENFKDDPDVPPLE